MSEDESHIVKQRDLVLVHSAWADGSSWSKLIPLLQAKELHAVRSSKSSQLDCRGRGIDEPPHQRAG
ncbi:MAG: hypothetical protein ABSE28_16610 [Candidatus Sulfotelmatobacter sp.]|jgi:hypothetical protein